jgi:hypothetical protein
MPHFNGHDAAIAPYSQSTINRLTKFVISAAFYAVRGVLRAVSRLLGRPQRGLAVGIYYHQVLPEQRARFARQMDYLLRGRRMG